MARTPFQFSLSPDFKEKLSKIEDTTSLRIIASKKVKQVVDFLQENPNSTQMEIVAGLGLTPDPANINPQMRALQQLGLIVKGEKTAYLPTDSTLTKQANKLAKHNPDVDLDPVEEPEMPEIEPEEELDADDPMSKIPAWQRKNTYFIKKKPIEEPISEPEETEPEDVDARLEKRISLEKELSDIKSKMKVLAKEFSSAKGTPRADEIKDELKNLTSKRNGVQDQLDNEEEISEPMIENYERLQKLAGI